MKFEPWNHKEIIELLGMPEHRYEAAMLRIGIKAECDDQKGRGKRKLFSFRNLLQFAYVNAAMLQEITPRGCTDILEGIDIIVRRDKVEIFNPESKTECKLHRIGYKGIVWFRFIGDSIPEKALPNPKWPFIDLLPTSNPLAKFINKMEISRNQKGEIHFPKGTIQEVQQTTMAMSIKDLCKFDTVTTINIGAIKANVLDKLSQMK